MSAENGSAAHALGRLVGRWTTEFKHPAFGDLVVHGTVEIEWLEGERFLIHRARTDHPEFPDSISILGFMEKDRAGGDSAEAGLSMHYYDSRGVFRDYHASIDDKAWKIWRDSPGFDQRFTGTFADGGRTVAGRWQLREGGKDWADDLEVVYRRS